MRKWAFNLMLSLLLIQASCAAQQSTGGSSGEAYSEDLTAYRPKFENESRDTTTGQEIVKDNQPVLASRTVNSKVDLVLDSLDKINRNRKFIDGFTIQIYSGQNREEAISAKSKMVMEIGDLDANVQYTQPKFRVTVGQYFSKLEAQKDLLRLRKLFANAILVPEKIPLN
ncbi:MAG: SPOR domain-containing protein [Cyclobacteriaceae bacterium]